MAQPLTLFFGEALIGAVFDGLRRLRPVAADALERLREVAEPPDDVAFVAQDGARYTGVVMLDGNRVVLMLAARQEPGLAPRTVERPPLITPPPAARQQGLYPRSVFEPEGPEPWDEDERYQRRYR